MGQLSAATLVCLLLLGCASASVFDSGPMTRAELPKPAHVWIHDFAFEPSPDGTPAELDGLLGHGARRKVELSDAERKLASELAEDIATRITSDLRALGLPAERVRRGQRPPPGEGPAVDVWGAFVQEGKHHKAAALGLGEGRLTTKVRVVERTHHGRVLVQDFSSQSRAKLGPARDGDAERSAKSREAAEDNAVAISARLAKISRELGWLADD